MSAPSENLSVSIEQINAIAHAMKQMAEMIECSNDWKDSQSLANGLAAMAEKISGLCNQSLSHMDAMINIVGAP